MIDNLVIENNELRPEVVERVREIDSELRQCADVRDVSEGTYDVFEVAELRSVLRLAHNILYDCLAWADAFPTGCGIGELGPWRNVARKLRRVIEATEQLHRALSDSSYSFSVNDCWKDVFVEGSDEELLRLLQQDAENSVIQSFTNGQEWSACPLMGKRCAFP